MAPPTPRRCSVPPHTRTLELFQERLAKKLPCAIQLGTCIDMTFMLRDQKLMTTDVRVPVGWREALLDEFERSG